MDITNNLENLTGNHDTDYQYIPDLKHVKDGKMEAVRHRYFPTDEE